jgi:hypothetical protein
MATDLGTMAGGAVANAARARAVACAVALSHEGSVRVDGDLWELADGSEVLVTVADLVVLSDGVDDVVLWGPSSPTGWATVCARVDGLEAV